MPKTATILFVLFSSLFSFNAVYADDFEIVHIRGLVEYASGPPELVKLDREGRINARALRAFGKLPEEFMTFALELRSVGIDLLTADMEQLDEYARDAETGAIKADPVKLRKLLTFLGDREYLTWVPVQPGQEIAEGDMVRGAEGADMTLRDAFGGESVIAPSGVLVISPEKVVFTRPDSIELTDKSDPFATEPASEAIAGELQPDASSPIRPTPEGLSPQASKLYQHWASFFTTKGFPLQAAGPIVVVELLGGIDLDIPLVDYNLEADDLSTNLLQLRYEPDLQGRMRYTAQLPKNVWLHDEYELPIGLLRFSGQDIKGVWLNELDGPTELDVLLEQAVFLPDALTADGDAQGKVIVEKIVLKTRMEENFSSLWNGEGFAQADNLRVIASNNQEGMRIGAIRCEGNVQDHDFKAFTDMLPVLLNALDSLDPAASSTMLQKLLQNYGDAEFTLTVSDAAISATDDLEYLRLASFEAKSGTQRTGHANQRGFTGTYQLRDFALKTDTSDLNIAGLSIDAELSDLDVAKAVQIAAFDLDWDDNPFSAFENLLDGLLLGFSVTGLRGNLNDVDFTGLDDLSMRFSVSGLNASRQDLSFAYQHAGFKGADMIPSGLTPEKLVLALRLSHIPVLELAVLGMLADEEATPLLFGLFAEHGSSLELDELEIAFPGGAIRMKGQALVDGAGLVASDEMPTLQMDAVLDIRGIDALTQTLATLMDDAEDVKHLNAMLAFIKLAAEERLADDGSTIHHLKIKGNNHGELTANGKDLLPLLILGAEDEE